MSWEPLFSAANSLALAGWLALLLLPRSPLLLQTIRFGVVGLLAAGYSALVFVYFFRVEGGGFGSLAAVKTLFSSDPVVLAGWMHYLAFDLLVGVWLAKRLDARRIARPVQAVVLLTTFMFGPLGYLLASAPTLVSSNRNFVDA
jgi:hypothetical protein